MWIPVWEQNYDWALEKDSEGIEVYTRNVDYSNIKQFRATCILNTSQENVLAVLRNVKNYPLWVQNVENAKTIDGGDTAQFYYQLSMPWPIKDRDIAMTMLETQEEESTVLIINSDPTLINENESFVRMKYVKGFWKITPLSNDSCKVTYQFLADPEGVLPTWTINMFLVDGPFKTLKNMKTYVAQ